MKFRGGFSIQRVKPIWIAAFLMLLPGCWRASTADQASGADGGVDGDEASETGSLIGNDGETDTGARGDGEVRITDTTNAVFVRECSGGQCLFIPEEPASTMPDCVNAFRTYDGRVLIVCGIIVDGNMASIPWHQCRPVICLEPNDCPPPGDSASYTCENGVCQNSTSENIGYDPMVLAALCANELPRENECGMVWSNEVYSQRWSELQTTCPDWDAEECRIPESCLQP